MKIISITKTCGRKITDGNYGSIESSTVLTVEEEIDMNEENKEKSIQKLKDLSDKVARQVRVLTNKDLKDYLELKNQGKIQ